MDLLLRRSTDGGIPVLAASGDVDLATVPRFRDALLRLIDDHPGERIAADLDAVVTLDDTGLGVLLGAAARARRLHGDLVLVSSGRRVRERLAATQIDRIVAVVAAVHLVAGADPPRG
jgi:anti-sigma B factor antagonist